MAEKINFEIVETNPEGIGFCKILFEDNVHDEDYFGILNGKQVGYFSSSKGITLMCGGQGMFVGEDILVIPSYRSHVKVVEVPTKFLDRVLRSIQDYNENDSNFTVKGYVELVDEGGAYYHISKQTRYGKYFGFFMDGDTKVPDARYSASNGIRLASFDYPDFDGENLYVRGDDYSKHSSRFRIHPDSIERVREAIQEYNNLGG